MRTPALVLIIVLTSSLLAFARSGGHSSYRSSSHSYSHSYSRSSTAHTYHPRTSTRSHSYVHTTYPRRSSRTTYSHSHAPRSTATHYYGSRDSHGRIKRSEAAKSAFKRQHPCPATGRSTGACPGYVIDHVNPLVCGGADAPSNMQWQTTVAAKAKDKVERRCR